MARKKEISVWINCIEKTVWIGDTVYTFENLGIHKCTCENEFYQNNIYECIEEHSGGKTPVYFFVEDK